MIMKPFEVLETGHLEVTCDGGKGALGHPRVFLHIERARGEVTCPYCSRLFVYRESASATAAGS